MRALRRVCVFCGSSPGKRPEYVAAAREVGRVLAGEGIAVVFGGGRIGMMGAVADGALDAGGQVIGVIPDGLMLREVAHEGLTEMLVVASMHERKQKMADLADAFVMLPGGFGTFEEFCEVVTWAQLGIHAKPCLAVNTNGYYDPLVAMFDHALAEGFVRAEIRGIVGVVDTPADLVPALRRHPMPDVERWMTAADT